MSMMEPDDAEWMPADDPAAQGMHGGWMNADQYDERVWGLPPRPPPGVRPPTGQLPGRPVWPFWGYWGYRLRNAQRDIKYLAEVVNDILDARLEQLAQTGVPGVTDGSNAAPGNVGEFVSGTFTAPYGQPSPTVAMVSGPVLSPGDWDMWANVAFSTAIAGGAFELKPVPSGTSNNMSASDFTTSIEAVQLNGMTARGIYSVQTLLAFQIYVATPPATSGTVTLRVEARRRR